MKKILYILAAILCVLPSCTKEQTLEEKIVGDWHCTAKSVKAEISKAVLGKEKIVDTITGKGWNRFKQFIALVALGMMVQI